MSNSQQYYFSVEKLKALIEDFKDLRKNSSEKKILRGFVFTPGEDNNGEGDKGESNPCCYAFPLYSDNPPRKPIEEGVILVQNTSKDPGCPYPPPCKTFKFNNENCYGKAK